MRILKKLKDKELAHRDSRLHLRLNHTLMTRLAECVKQEPYSRTDLIECLIVDFLNQYERGSKDVSLKSDKISNTSGDQISGSSPEGSIEKLVDDINSSKHGSEGN